MKKKKKEAERIIKSLWEIEQNTVVFFWLYKEGIIAYKIPTYSMLLF